MILAGVLLVLFLLGQVRVGLRGEYTVSGLKVWARLGVLKLRLLPWRKKKPAREKKPLPKPIQKETEKPKTLPGGALDYARELLPLALEAAGQFRRKLQVDELRLRLVAGSSDPADAALHYGQAWAAVGALMPALDRLFVIKKRDICPILDYNREQMSVDAHLILTITIGRALALGLKAGLGFLKLLNDSKKGGANT